jgi:sortase (surface protein transpeptidase)
MPRTLPRLAPLACLALFLVVVACRPDRDAARRPRRDAEAAGQAQAVQGTGADVVPITPSPTALPPTVAPMPTETPLPTPTDPPTSTPDPFVASGLPARLEIPAIGVDAVVESVGLTADRAMGVPKGWMNVGWYNQGFRPGENGNAVVAGHLDTNTGGPAVFWSLDKLQPGDELTVSYENGDRYTFVVESLETYAHDTEGPIIDRIFGESLTADLNLVTCDGAWDHGKATYTHRLVVFTTLLPEKTVRAGGTVSTVQ